VFTLLGRTINELDHVCARMECDETTFSLDLSYCYYAAPASLFLADLSGNYGSEMYLRCVSPRYMYPSASTIFATTKFS
jgi:hypothetical protein